MREKFKKIEKGGKDLDLKGFGYEIIDERYVGHQAEAENYDEEGEEEYSEGGESDMNDNMDDQVD